MSFNTYRILLSKEKFQGLDVPEENRNGKHIENASFKYQQKVSNLRKIWISKSRRLKEFQVHLTKSSSDIFKFQEKRQSFKIRKETKSNGPKQISSDLLLISQLESYRPREDGTTYTESCDRKKLKTKQAKTVSSKINLQIY